MNYRIVTIYNHNVVLAKDDKNQYVMIISKGIGFGKNIGDKVKVLKNTENKIFYVLDKPINEGQIQKINLDLEPLKDAVSAIVLLAKDNYNIQDPKLYDALLEHISFTIQRINLGIVTENPFVEEIRILYRVEMEIADLAAQVIKKYIGIEINIQERGFIALHVFSARKHRPVESAVKLTRIYNGIINTIGTHFNKNINRGSNSCNGFLLNLDSIVKLSSKGIELQIDLKNDVEEKIHVYYEMAKEVAQIIQREIGITINGNNVVFLAIDICRLVQT